MMKTILNYASFKKLYKWQARVDTSNLTRLELYVLDYMLSNNKLDFYMKYRYNHYDKEEYKIFLFTKNNFGIFNLYNKVEVYILVCDESEKTMTLSEYIKMRNHNILKSHYWEIPISSIYSRYMKNEWLN